ncbi:FAD-dependent monooxygenase [Streptomyces sp. NPDC058471]|uniref:FAD-dependent monooxygenase n=1 Tax=Streptomyces sp. NPDC058471 TaxID=3346516 RepID=UPI003653D148
MDADVIIVGAGPTGLMLAGELRLAGVRPVVLEQHAQRRDIPKAGGLGGQILELLRYRGLLERYEAACPGQLPAPRFPFGGVHVDLTSLQDPPMHALPLPQPQLEQLLEERAGELDVDIRRGRRVVGVSQDEAGVTVDARCPDGTRRLRARYVVAGDAAHLFPATGVALNAGMLDAVNLAWKLAAAVNGQAHTGPTVNDWAHTGLLDTYHSERHLAAARTMLHTQAQVALRRAHDPAAEALREVFQELLTDEAPLRRMGALIAGTDIIYPMPGASPHALSGTFAPDLRLHGERGTTSVAELMHTARPVLLDLADREDVREAAGGWRQRVDVHTAKTDDRPADALLIRPDGHIAWAAAVDEPTDTSAPDLREALSTWFGAPR